MAIAYLVARLYEYSAKLYITLAFGIFYHPTARLGTALAVGFGGC